MVGPSPLSAGIFVCELSCAAQLTPLNLGPTIISCTQFCFLAGPGPFNSTGTTRRCNTGKSRFRFADTKEAGTFCGTPPVKGVDRSAQRKRRVCNAFLTAPVCQADSDLFKIKGEMALRSSWEEIESSTVTFKSNQDQLPTTVRNPLFSLSLIHDTLLGSIPHVRYAVGWFERGLEAARVFGYHLVERP